MGLSRVRRLVALVTLVGSVGLVAGCTTEDRGLDDGGGSAAGPSATSTPGVRETDLTTIDGPTGEFQVPGSDQDTVTVGVLGLEADGGAQVLSLVLTPHFASKAKGDSVSLSDMLGGSRFSPTLIDQKNLEIYFPIDDGSCAASDRCFSASSPSTRTVNGQPMYVYAVFVAPKNTDAVDFDLQVEGSWPQLQVKAEKK